MDEPGMGCSLASGSGGGEGKRGKQSILKCCSGSFILLLDPELAPNPILMQTEFQQLWAGGKRQGSRMCLWAGEGFPPPSYKGITLAHFHIVGILPFVIGKLHNPVSD